jgi:peptidoglycan hydrolase CwlO-like protein
MKSLDEVFAGNQNSYDYLSAKLKNLTEAQDAYRKKTETLPDVIKFLRDRQKELADNTDDLKQKMEQATAAYDNAENKTAALKRAMNEATKEFNDNQKALNYARDAANDYQRQLTEAEGKVDVLGEEIRKTNGYLREAAVSADGTATSIDRYGKEVKDAGEDTKSFGEAANVLAQAIVASGAVQGAEKLRDAIVDTAKASIEYESAFAGVRKTVDGTAEELDAISGGLRSMSLEIPMAVEGLAGIAENAGQLGIAKDSILDFTETIAALSVTTNLSAEEAATSLAKFANVTNMSEKNYSNLGSSIVALGNNFATTEADIVAMATRLAATGEIVGLTEPQILAVATALSSVGIEAEAGGSAFSKLLKTIDTAVRTGGEGLEEYARIAGMSASMFASAWEQDAVAAVAKFVDGLGRMDEAGGSAVATLNELGL